MSARFEIVRTDAEHPWHARFRAANGRIVWTTENYVRRSAALNAIASMASPLDGWIDLGGVCTLSSRDSWNKKNHVLIPIREVDERATA